MKQLLSVAAIAMAAFSSTPAMAAGAPYAVKGGRHLATQVCETRSVVSSCVEVAPVTDNADLLDVTRVNVGLHSTTTWIETRIDSYQLCAVNATFERQCEKLRIPHLRGTHLTTATRSDGRTTLRLVFHTVEQKPNQTQRRTLGDAFLLELRMSRDSLNDVLASAQAPAALLMPGKAHRDAFPRTGSLVTAYDDCPPNEEESRTAPGGPTTNDVGCDGGGGGGDDGGDGGDGLGGKDPACVAGCNVSYDEAIPYCNEMTTPQLRAICFAAAGAALGTCIALC